MKSLEFQTKCLNPEHFEIVLTHKMLLKRKDILLANLCLVIHSLSKTLFDRIDTNNYLFFTLIHALHMENESKILYTYIHELQQTNKPLCTCSAFLTTSETYLNILWRVSRRFCSMEWAILLSAWSSVSKHAVVTSKNSVVK